MRFKAMGKTTALALLPALALPLLALAALPLPAGAAPIAAPPGNSEADQYFETVPAPAGGRSRDSSKTAEDSVREGRLSAETARALERRGETGQALATAVAQTAPGGKPGDGPPPPQTAGAPAPTEQGLGALFPLILVATAAGAAGFAVARWRGTPAR